jgi:hypothetical protein
VRDEWKEVQADRRFRIVVEDLGQAIIDNYLTIALIEKGFSKIENYDRAHASELLG